MWGGVAFSKWVLSVGILYYSNLPLNAGRVVFFSILACVAGFVFGQMRLNAVLYRWRGWKFENIYVTREWVGLRKPLK